MSVPTSVPIVKAVGASRTAWAVPLAPSAELPAAAVEKAAHRFMNRYAQATMLDGRDGVTVAESMVAPISYQLGQAAVLKGSWVLALKVHDDALWRAIEAGDVASLELEFETREGIGKGATVEDQGRKDPDELAAEAERQRQAEAMGTMQGLRNLMDRLESYSLDPLLSPAQRAAAADALKALQAEISKAMTSPLRRAVAQGVREQLGREPLDKMEEIRTRMALYKSHPGLHDAVVREERASRVGVR